MPTVLKRCGLAGAAFAFFVCGMHPSSRADDAPVSAILGPRQIPDADGYVLVPGGRVHASCVNEVPSGSEIDIHKVVRYNGHVLGQLKPCNYPKKDAIDRGSGATHVPATINHLWLGYSWSNPINSFGYAWFNNLVGYWYVPNPPSSYASQTIYIFNAFQDNPTTEIIQPVLQYGTAANGGGNYWQESSWHVWNNNNNYVYATPHKVQPGMQFLGNIYPQTSTSCPSSGLCTFNVASWTGGVGSVLTTTVFHPMTEVFQGVIEVWNVSSCAQMPSDGVVYFTNTSVYEPGPGANNANDVTASMSWNDISNDFGQPLSGCSTYVSSGQDHATISFLHQ